MRSWIVIVFAVVVVAGCSNPAYEEPKPDFGIKTGENPLKGQKAKEEGQGFQLERKVITDKELGVPFYPGSGLTSLEGGKLDREEGETLVAWRATTDLPMQVIAFYKQEVPGATTTETPKLATLNGTLKNGSAISVTVTREGETLIQITVKKGTE